jgi:hypothetical protein
MHLFFIIFPWVEHLHQFEVPRVGILYNYAYPTVGNVLLSKCKFPIDSGGGGGWACLPFIETLFLARKPCALATSITIYRKDMGHM